MNVKYFGAGLVAGLMSVALLTSSTVAKAQSDLPQSTSNNTPLEYQTDGYKQWNISAEDWTKYVDLMQSNSEAKMFYGHLEPAYLLGIYAETDSERERLAELVFQGEKERARRLLTFDRIVKRKKISDPTPVFDREYLEQIKTLQTYMQDQKKQAMASSNSSPTPNRPVIAVDVDCRDCISPVSKLLSLKNISFDVYFLGSPTDAEMSKWASQAKIPFDKVEAGSITLSRDDTNALKSFKDQLPVIFTDNTLTTVIEL